MKDKTKPNYCFSLKRVFTRGKWKGAKAVSCILLKLYAHLETSVFDFFSFHSFFVCKLPISFVFLIVLKNNYLWILKISLIFHPFWLFSRGKRFFSKIVFHYNYSFNKISPSVKNDIFFKNRFFLLWLAINAI